MNVTLLKPDNGSVFVARGADGFYVVLSGPATDPIETVMGGPHQLESTAQAEAKFLAADFGARLLHHGWGH